MICIHVNRLARDRLPFRDHIDFTETLLLAVIIFLAGHFALLVCVKTTGKIPFR